MTLPKNRTPHVTIRRLRDDALGVTVVYLAMNTITSVPAAMPIGAWVLLTTSRLLMAAVRARIARRNG